MAISSSGSWELREGTFLLPELHTTGYRPEESSELYRPVKPETEIPLNFIPYYAFVSRGTGEMQA